MHCTLISKTGKQRLLDWTANPEEYAELTIHDDESDHNSQYFRRYGHAMSSSTIEDLCRIATALGTARASIIPTIGSFYLADTLQQSFSAADGASMPFSHLLIALFPEYIRAITKWAEESSDHPEESYKIFIQNKLEKISNIFQLSKTLQYKFHLHDKIEPSSSHFSSVLFGQMEKFIYDAMPFVLGALDPSTSHIATSAFLKEFINNCSAAEFLSLHKALHVTFSNATDRNDIATYTGIHTSKDEFPLLQLNSHELEALMTTVCQSPAFAYFNANKRACQPMGNNGVVPEIGIEDEELSDEVKEALLFSDTESSYLVDQTSETIGQSLDGEAEDMADEREEKEETFDGEDENEEDNVAALAIARRLMKSFGMKVDENHDEKYVETSHRYGENDTAITTSSFQSSLLSKLTFSKSMTDNNSAKFAARTLLSEKNTTDSDSNNMSSGTDQLATSDLSSDRTTSTSSASSVSSLIRRLSFSNTNKSIK